MGKSIKAKLTIGALGLVIIVCIAITGVVSFIINRQNIQAVQRDLEKARTVVETELSEKQRNLASEMSRMVVENKVGDTVRFLFDYSEDSFSMTESTYNRIANTVLGKATAIDFRQVSIYDLNGNLQVFATRESQGAYQFGFYRKPEVHINVSRKDEAVDEGAWVHTEQVDKAQVDLHFKGNLPESEHVYLGNRNGSLVIETLTPVFATEYDDNDNSFQKQFGFIHTIKELDMGLVERLSLLTGMSVNIFAGNQLSLGQLTDYKEVEATLLNAGTSRDGSDEQEAEVDDIVLGDGRFFQTVLPTLDQHGVSGAVVILQSDAIVKSNNYQMMKILIIVSLVCLGMIIPLVLLFSRSIVKPIIHIVERMKDIAEGDGDLRNRIAITSKDEVGQLAENFNTFVEKIQILVGQVKENLGPLNESSQSLKDIASSLADGAGQSSAKAGVVAAAGEEMSSNMNTIAAAMEEAATNVNLVSANAQQMSVNIEEVIENTVNARDITADAVSQTIKASQQVEELGGAASEIEKVIETITEISEQVNLLALNATIEAARAGDAGKGFAVVANEIKELAKQTASATNEIKEKVTNIRNSTDGTVSEIETITSVNHKISDIVQLISDKIEEQSKATNDIAENVSQASIGLGDVNENVAQSSVVASEIAVDIVEVTETSQEISQSSALVNERATELSSLSEKLNEIVNRFQV